MLTRTWKNLVKNNKSLFKAAKIAHTKDELCHNETLRDEILNQSHWEFFEHFQAS